MKLLPPPFRFVFTTLYYPFGDSFGKLKLPPSQPTLISRWPLKGRQCFQIVITRDKTNQEELSPLRGRNEAFRGLPEWQAVPSEESTVPCATEDPIGSEMKLGVMERRG